MRAANPVIVIAVVVCLFCLSVMVYQATNVADLHQTAPVAAAIDSAAAELVVDSRPSTGLAQVRRDMEGLLTRIEVQSPKGRGLQNADLADLRKAVSDLRLVESDVGIAHIRLVGTLTEIRGRAELLKRNLGLAVPIDRAAGLVVKDLLVALIGWPLVVLLLAAYLMTSRSAPERLRNILKQLKSLKVAGLEWTLTDETGSDAQQAFGSYRVQVQAEFDAWQREGRIPKAVKEILAQFDSRLPNPKPPYRCAIHVPDALFQDTLYQLTDYVPSGSGRGRAWSIRYGMIGRQWRLRESRSATVIPEEEVLVRDWGMTRAEAKRPAKQRSLLCVVLRTKPADPETEPVGILYVDSEKEHAFGDEQNVKRLLKWLEEASSGLADDLDLMQEQMKSRKLAPSIKIYD
jgi:hypothetical protein